MEPCIYIMCAAAINIIVFISVVVLIIPSSVYLVCSFVMAKACDAGRGLEMYKCLK